MNFRLAAKSFIVDSKGNILLIKRRSNDVHKPGAWDIPGGRLELGEDPFLGLKREVKEETNLDVNILAPLHIQHFTRDDGQKITMIIFFCKPIHTNLKLSEEHIEFTWTDFKEDKIPNWLDNCKENYLKYFY